MENKAPTEQIVQSHGDSLSRCCLEHPEAEWRSGIVQKVLYWWDSNGSYADGTERSGFAVFLTDDGKFAVLEDWEDYTGHGCQCHSSLTTWDTLEKALSLGLTEEQNGKKIEA